MCVKRYSPPAADSRSSSTSTMESTVLIFMTAANINRLRTSFPSNLAIIFSTGPSFRGNHYISDMKRLLTALVMAAAVVGVSVSCCRKAPRCGLRLRSARFGYTSRYRICKQKRYPVRKTVHKVYADMAEKLYAYKSVNEKQGR